MSEPYTIILSKSHVFNRIQMIVNYLVNKDNLFAV